MNPAVPVTALSASKAMDFKKRFTFLSSLSVGVRSRLRTGAPRLAIHPPEPDFAVSNAFLQVGMNFLSFHQFKRKMIPLGRLLCSGMILGWLCFPAGAWGGPSSHIHTPESPVNPPAILPAGSAENVLIGPETATPPEPAETQWLPLREIIQQYSEATGNQVRIKDDETFDQLYSVNDPSWLEDFSRIEILNEQTGKKEIILLGRAGGRPPAKSSRINKTARIHPTKSNRINKTARIHPETTLSREKLQKLIKGAMRSPLPVNLYEDPEYRKFFAQLGVTAPRDLKNGRYTSKIRRVAHRLLNRMRAN